jgi:hypothetical protein
MALVDNTLLIRAIQANTELHLRFLSASGISLLSIVGIVDYLVNQFGYVLVAGTVFTGTCKLRLTMVDILLLIRFFTWNSLFQVGEIRFILVGCRSILILLVLSTPFGFGSRGGSDFWGGRLIVHYYIGV